MAYNEDLAGRVRALLAEQADLAERKMFGCLVFMVQGNMCCGIMREGLLVRVGPERYAAALARPHAHVMDFTGRPMTGIVIVTADGLASDTELGEWVGQALAFVSSLPPK